MENWNPKNIEILAECYANEFIAGIIASIIRKKYNINKRKVKVRHTPKLGRDEIVRRILKPRSSNSTLRLGVIDYEEGVSRTYIDKNFKLLTADHRIFIGLSYKTSALAIIFDPRIEESLIAEVCPDVYHNAEKLEKVKSREASKLLRKYQSRIEEIMARVLSKVEINTSRNILHFQNSQTY